MILKYNQQYVIKDLKMSLNKEENRKTQ
jgi:hypothetical protein